MKNCLALVSYEINHEILNYYSSVKNCEIISVSPSISILIKRKYPKIKFFKDSFFLKKNKFIDATHRPNWYYQQFLKYSIILKFDNYNLIHIVDGDSFLDLKYLFYKDFLYSPINVNPNYQKFTNQFNSSLNSKTNFIVNHMVFEKKLLVKMLNYYGSSVDTYIEDFCKKLITGDVWFSEYQNYAMYVLKNEITRKKIPSKVFRRFESVFFIKKNNLPFKHYSLVSNEINHKISFLRKIRINILYLFKKNLG